MHRSTSTRACLQWPNPTATAAIPITVRRAISPVFTRHADLHADRLEHAPRQPAGDHLDSAAVRRRQRRLPLHRSSATDPQGGNLTYTYAPSPAMSNLSINSTTGVVSWTPNSAEIGTEAITITVTDTAGSDGGPELQRQRGQLAAADDLERHAAEHAHGRPDVHLPGPGQRPGRRHAHLLAGRRRPGHGDRPIRPDHLADNRGQHRRSYSYQVKVTNPDGLSVTSPAIRSRSSPTRRRRPSRSMINPATRPTVNRWCPST